MVRDTPSLRPYLLGLDLGANSIGWVALALDPTAVAGREFEPVGLLHPPDAMGSTPSIGVRVFEIGVENYGQGEREESRGVKRRNARLARRQAMRRARRQRKVFYLLQRAGLLPAFPLDALEASVSREVARDGLLKQLDLQIAAELQPQLPASESRAAFERLPYLLRARALDQELKPYEVGRAIYHLAQRRGFLSNRKTGGKKSEDDGQVKAGISELAKAIATSGARTLGEHLHREGLTGKSIRRRWTARQMFQEEFELIWSHQAGSNPTTLTDQLRRKLRRALFFQRPLKSQRGLVGTCELEDGGEWINPNTGEIRATRRRRRAPCCLLVSQRFRYLQRVNDLRVIEHGQAARALQAYERSRLIEALEREGDQTFTQAKNLLGIKRADHKKIQFNFELAGTHKGLEGNRTNADLLQLFGERWTELADVDKDRVVLEIWGAPDDQTLSRRAETREGVWSLLRPSPAQADRLSSAVRIGSEYMALSGHAMSRLLPAMASGTPYMTALRDAYGERSRSEPMEFLPPAQSVAGEIRNPVVTRALSELRRLINTLIRAYGKPTAIRIELARDLKRGKDDRAKDIKKNKDNERTRLDAAERIVREAGISGPSASDILRVRLWEECGKACPYTGRSIGFAQLFGEDVDVEHIVPFSKSLDDSFINKTICFAEVNRREKGNRTPSEAFGAQPDRWAEMVQRMKHNVEAYGMPRAKLERFLLAGEALEERMAEFKSSQLNDTRYASRSARQYLAHLYGGVVSQGVDSQGRLRVQVGNGQVTALLRRVLGMNQLLETPLGDKRSDHRHHAVDAVAVALTSPSMQHSLAKGCEDAWSNRRRRLGNIEVPWTGFDRDVRAAVDRIVVSHRIDNRVRGALHAETLYSPPRDKDGRRAVDAGFSHVRKPLERLSPSEVEDIVDERVKRHVIDHLAGRLPSKVYASEVPESFPTLPNRHGAPIPIKRVRIRKKNSTREIGSGNRLRFVENSENHHLEIVEAADSKGRPKWVGTVVTVAMASARRSSPNFPIVERRPGFQLSLCKNDVVELDTQPGHRALFLVRGISQFSAGQVVLDFSQICDARQVGKIPRQGRTATPDVLRQRNCRKVTVLPIGVLRPCRA